MKEKRYSTGQEIPQSGIYCVFHPAHRLIRTVRLLKGDRFPRCSQCADQVSFEFVTSSFTVDVDGDVHIYELPLQDQEEGAASA
jgi:hypothetical protein